MSAKNGKRSRRKTEDEEFKAPVLKKVESKPEDDELKGFESENGVKEEDRMKTRSRSNTPLNIKKSPQKANVEMEEKTEEEVKVIEDVIKPEEEVIKPANDEVVVVVECDDKVDEEKVEDVNGGSEKEEEVVATATEVPATPEEASQDNSEDIEMEPLIVDTEEVDPELQFDEASDSESRKGSPVLSRCRTRRSQTRNIPTPKTPKSVIDQNGDDKDSDKTPSELLDTPEATDSQESTSESSSSQKTTDDKSETIVNIDLTDTNESFESETSMHVNVGGDLTREIDITVSDESSFLNSAKDLSVVETIRRMSSRRAIRSTGDYRRSLLKSKAEKYQYIPPIPAPPRATVHINSEVAATATTIRRSSVEKLIGSKRKTRRSDSPDGAKRFKITDSNPGFMSYISSPISKIKSKFTPGEVSASTPKLTGYRKQDILEGADLSKIEIPIHTATPSQHDKKWCSIM
ncbi:PREDICTED: altered inheritance of mitochondria protein 21-like [Nicrophorus vespilloides]|uniref:Altered inheritance of mitochondria protein 21-like n=1 Tax=Nicrophorus vespilloides TaxID=110193 RepID=A0ABM1MDX1_NICVS|nr:PREDICTED: altered inheritance of mitochondria protein 21-like [Nicrophorus vespilloides]XP_017772771.1 PREDICTED: altered inheritance of mitochondria protein 21-like [Nicrophorus vespilloides]